MYVDDLSNALSGIRPGGCVQPYVAGFATQLLASGYTVLSMRDVVTSATHLGRWMDLCGIGVDTVTPSTVGRFAKHDCRCPGVRAHHRAPSRRSKGGAVPVDIGSRPSCRSGAALRQLAAALGEQRLAVVPERRCAD